MMISMSHVVLFILFLIYSIPCECLTCYECTGYIPCGQGQTELVVDCSGKCMVYRNQYDSDMIIRRCCTTDCGTTDGIRDYEGRNPAYFCSQDLCNEYGSEAALTGGTISTFITPTVTSITTITTLSSTQSPVTIPTSVECFDCLGPNCGIKGSTITSNCPSCMVFRNPVNPTIIERRCCRSSCGNPFTVQMYNNLQTYFCAYNQCNRYGVETILSPPGTTTSSTMTTSLIPTTTTAYTTTPVCILTCQNGGTLDINGCFCYCVDKTSGQRCENIDCLQPDDPDTGICVPENLPLCSQSQIFLYKCLHICRIC